MELTANSLSSLVPTISSYKKESRTRVRGAFFNIQGQCFICHRTELVLYLCEGMGKSVFSLAYQWCFTQPSPHSTVTSGQLKSLCQELRGGFCKQIPFILRNLREKNLCTHTWYFSLILLWQTCPGVCQVLYYTTNGQKGHKAQQAPFWAPTDRVLPACLCLQSSHICMQTAAGITGFPPT